MRVAASQRLQIFNFLSPSVVSQRTLTPVRLHNGQVPRHPATAFAFFPRFGFGIYIPFPFFRLNSRFARSIIIRSGAFNVNERLRESAPRKFSRI